jgi:hypothetical protein
MKIQTQTYITPNHSITIESGEHELTRECTQEIKQAVADLKLDVDPKKALWLFGVK